jgi:hypothetical protein
VLILLFYLSLQGLAQLFCTSSSLHPWVEPPLKSSLKQSPSPTSDASTSISTMLFGWVHLESSPLHDIITSSHCLVSSWHVQPSLVQMSTILMIILHSLLTHYSLIKRWWSGQQCFPL